MAHGHPPAGRRPAVKALILAGGQGTRLRPLTDRLPKPMAPIVNRPFLERMLGWLRRHRITEVVLAIGYLPEVVRAHFGDGAALGAHIDYAIETKPLGTGGGIQHAAAGLDSTCLAFNGDILTDIDLTAVLAAHRQRRALATLTLIEVPDPSRFGVVEIDADSRVRAFREKPAPGETVSRTINAGIYVLEPDAVRRMPTGAFSIEREFFPSLIAAEEPVYGYLARNCYWKDVGTIQQYLEAHDDIFRLRFRTEIPGRLVRPGLFIEGEASIAPDAALADPVVIGPGVVIERGARLSGGVTVGAGARIGAGAQVHHSVLWPEAVVEAGAMVRSSILATGARVAAGAVLRHRALGPDEVWTEKAAAT